MANNFEMIGSLKIAKGTDKFPNYEVKTFDSGWTIKTLRLQATCDGNSHNVEINGGYGGDESIVYSLKKKPNGEKGTDKVQFKFKDREKHIQDLAEFKKSVFVNGEDRHEFATQVDLAEFVHMELKKEEYVNKKFKISGEIEFSEYQNKVYTRYNVNRIYVVSDEEEEKAEAQIEMYIGENCVDDESLEDTDTLYIRGHVGQYDGRKRAEVGITQIVELTISKDDKKRDRKVDKIKENCEPKSDEYLSRIGVKVNLINKAEDVEFNESMLTEEQLEDLELGFTTIEDLKSELGIGKGKFERKMTFKGWARGYSQGCMETDITLDELLRKGEKAAEQTNIEIDSDEFDDDDLFE